MYKNHQIGRGSKQGKSSLQFIVVLGDHEGRPYRREIVGATLVGVTLCPPSQGRPQGHAPTHNDFTGETEYPYWIVVYSNFASRHPAFLRRLCWWACG